MRCSSFLAFILSTITVSAELTKGSKCGNFGAEWCLDGEILTCKQIPFTDSGRVKSTHKVCDVKRDVGDPCPKPGKVWCQDHEILTCSELFTIEGTGVGCGTKLTRDVEKRKINDYCDKPGVSWCQDNQILFCWQVPERNFGLIAGTGLACDQ